MALFVKLVQNIDPLTPRAFGLWFGRAVHLETITLKELATTMQENCTVKRSDILAVLAELVDTMKYEMQRGRKVSIDGLGTFRLGVHSRVSPFRRSSGQSATSSIPTCSSCLRNTKPTTDGAWTSWPRARR